jgi:ribose 5-phosphate isomerase B
MKIAVACDHRGYEAKEIIKSHLIRNNFEVTDFGTDGSKSCDYPDFAIPAALAVRNGEVALGILVCGNGIGMSITANKVKGIRAALCNDELMAQMSREHNNANMICLPGMLVNESLLTKIIDVWVSTDFLKNDGRHDRRVKKMMGAEDTREIDTMAGGC